MTETAEETMQKSLLQLIRICTRLEHRQFNVQQQAVGQIMSVVTDMEKQVKNMEDQKTSAKKKQDRAILPRWDNDSVYEQSLYFNLKLHCLTKEFVKCTIVDCTRPFSFSYERFRFDGLHLNKQRKKHLFKGTF